MKKQVKIPFDPARGNPAFSTCVAMQHWSDPCIKHKDAKRGEVFLCNCTAAEFAWFKHLRASWRGSFKSIRLGDSKDKLKPMFGRKKK